MCCCIALSASEPPTPSVGFSYDKKRAGWNQIQSALFCAIGTYTQIHTKVWRFFQAHGDVFTLRRLPGNLGCLIFNLGYPCDTELQTPAAEEISALLGELRHLGRAQSFDRVTMNRVIAWYSSHASAVVRPKSRVALSYNIYRAYLSLVEVRSTYRYDCRGVDNRPPGSLPNIEQIRGLNGFTGFI